MINTDRKAIEKIVTRGVERVFPNEDFLIKRLSSGEQLTVYLGIDPTGSSLHMGNIIPLRKLSQIQKLGHKVVLLIGDFTAQIGDPDKGTLRNQLTHADVLENAKQYQQQASTILDFKGDNKAELKYNAQWLGEMNFSDVIKLASQVTVQNMLNRDMFKKRIKSENPIYIHEFLYPLMQGYDSVAMGVDGEVGGNDQTFNMLVGRDLLKNADVPKEKFVIPMKLLVDNNGDKMGKTTGNMLSLEDNANEMFKKIMQWSDEMILNAFELLTDVNLLSIEKRMNSDENPRDIKFDLGLEVIKIFCGEQEAVNAKEAWINDVQQDAVPEDIPSFKLQDGLVGDIVNASGESKTQVRRLLDEGAVKVNDKKIDLSYTLVSGDVVQIGKKRWYKAL